MEMTFICFLRDPNAIRPAYYYSDDEIVVITSERPVIQTAFNVDVKFKEIKIYYAMLFNKKRWQI